jgi:glycyl-tRNA synthetase
MLCNKIRNLVIFVSKDPRRFIMKLSPVTLEKLVALCKRRGLVYQSSEIYSGLNGVYDFGPLGAQIKQNIRNLWISSVMTWPEEVLMLDGSILGPKAVWEASGHLENFSDPMVDCLNCKKRFRADELNLDKPCLSCGVKKWTEVRQFQLMFETNLGAMSERAQKAYLRPETAQDIFINFKNILTSNRVKIPFGIAQIGKAFRNEITPKQFLFRMREFEQMELEFFCKEEDADRFFEVWKERRRKFYEDLGLDKNKIRFRAHESNELAHYSRCCDDVEYQFPFGWKELEGIANRSDYDLSRHSQFSGKDLSVFDDQAKTSYVPWVIECSVGVDRLFLTVLFDSYCEEEVEGELRTVFKISPALAPVTAAILPLTNKLKEQTEKCYHHIKKRGYRVQFDTSGSIGKRYRRQDEIGTPACFTFDFESPEDNMMTVRNRDTLKQERISIDRVPDYLDKLIG